MHIPEVNMCPKLPLSEAKLSAGRKVSFFITVVFIIKVGFFFFFFFFGSICIIAVLLKLPVFVL